MMILHYKREKRHFLHRYSAVPTIHLSPYYHFPELLAQATSALLFGKSSDFSTINLHSSLQHLALLIIPSVLNFSSPGFRHTSFLASLFLSSLLLLCRLLSWPPEWRCFMVFCPGSSLPLLLVSG